MEHMNRMIPALEALLDSAHSDLRSSAQRYVNDVEAYLRQIQSKVLAEGQRLKTTSGLLGPVIVNSGMSYHYSFWT